MSKYRFKNKEEFIRDGLWDKENNCPYYWNSAGKMNKYLGKDVPDEYVVNCDKKETFIYDGWIFQNKDYTLKEQQKYFNDLSQHIGRYIRALVDNPHAGRGVYKGDVGKIISNYRVAFPNNIEYSCTNALNKGYIGTKYELLPEDYSPEKKEPNIEFIPGKWYNFTTMKGKYSLYVKVSSVTDKSLFFMNEKSISNGHFGEAICIGLKLIENPRLVEDLSEIQEYLPDGHPDKITFSEFKKGEYIVITDNYSKSFCTNYIYKQRKDCIYLQAELDNNGRRNNGFWRYEKKNSHNWRYATQEEINEYERRGRPYNVTELNKQSLPEENSIEVPEYIEAIDSFSDYFISGKIYKVKNSNNLISAVLNCNDLVNFNEYDNLYVNLTGYRWKPSTKEAYEQQKIWLKVSDFNEVRQYPSTSSDCWKNIPKFVEQKEFDIYGPTPDIE